MSGDTLIDRLSAHAAETLEQARVHVPAGLIRPAVVAGLELAMAELIALEHLAGRPLALQAALRWLSEPLAAEQQEEQL